MLDDGSISSLMSNQWSHSALAHTLSGQIRDPNTFDCDQVKTWIRQCDEVDTCGESKFEAISPQKLIDCRRREICENTSSHPYVCLSYLWGPNLPVQIETHGTLPEHLPVTISDAMIVTLEVGLRYLWVDRYCIDQSNAEEKHNNIRNMNAICKSALTCDHCLNAHISSQSYPRTCALQGLE
jgi:hypothetical protein